MTTKHTQLCLLHRWWFNLWGDHMCMDCSLRHEYRVCGGLIKNSLCDVNREGSI